MTNKEIQDIDKLVMQEINRASVLDKYVRQEINRTLKEIKAEIKDLHNSHMINFVSADGVVDTCLEIIDKHIGKEGAE